MVAILLLLIVKNYELINLCRIQLHNVHTRVCQNPSSGSKVEVETHNISLHTPTQAWSNAFTFSILKYLKQNFRHQICEVEKWHKTDIEKDRNVENNDMRQVVSSVKMSTDPETLCV
jgi:hypothetical protein